MKRLSVVFAERTFKDMLASIERENKVLEDLARVSRELEPIRQDRRALCPHELFQRIRKRAASLYRAIVTGDAWQCNCRTDHTASLRLDHRPQDFVIRREDGVLEQGFRMFLTKRCPSVAGGRYTPKTLEWKEIEVCTVEVEPNAEITFGSGPKSESAAAQER